MARSLSLLGAATESCTAQLARKGETIRKARLALLTASETEGIAAAQRQAEEHAALQQRHAGERAAIVEAVLGALDRVHGEAQATLDHTHAQRRAAEARALPQKLAQLDFQVLSTIPALLCSGVVLAIDGARATE